ncbi:serine O-acetyltransferase EpsC [Deltaproteobacteria bacterium TL4]
MDDQRRLATAVNLILDSYHKHPEIEQMGRTILPAKENIILLAKDIQVLLFPGLIRQESMETLELPYVIGQKSVSIFHRLQEYMEQIFCWEAAQNGINCTDTQKFKTNVKDIAFEFLESLPGMREILAEDVEAIYEGDPAARSKREIVFAYPGLQALSIHRIAHFFFKRNVPILPRIMSEYIHSQTGIDIHPGATLGKGTMIDHGTGIVIGETSIIQDYVRIYQGVTIGALSPDKKDRHSNVKRHPTIEDHVVLYAGATILGGKTVIGQGSIIGGNVWLTHSVPPGSKIYLENQ